MGIFRKAAPNDALIEDFWVWFAGFENVIKDVLRDAGSESPNDEKAHETVMILSERIQKICFDTKELVEFEFGGDVNIRPELVFYPHSPYVKDNIKRMAELMPAALKEKWDIVISS